MSDYIARLACEANHINQCEDSEDKQLADDIFYALEQIDKLRAELEAVKKERDELLSPISTIKDSAKELDARLILITANNVLAKHKEQSDE